MSDQRLEAIEDRLARIERQLGLGETPTGQPEATAPPPAARAPKPRRQRRSIDPTKLMAWAASLAFILAAAYFVKLVYDAGWLTPQRQIGLAMASGFALIGGGLVLARVDRAYAAYPPAVGVVVLYLSVFAGHAFYQFFGLYSALGAVAATTLSALWLGRRFDNSAYALLAVVGTYGTPLLIDAARADVVDLVVYFTAWGLLFSFIALQEARRPTYLLALFFALFGFDIAFRMTNEEAWAAAAGYQLAQFAVFSGTAVLFSVRHRQPMQHVEAAVHGLALFYFYLIEYILLKQHAEGVAAWFALGSVAVVFGLYQFARLRLGAEGLRSGALLTSTYCSVVSAHILFFELMPEGGIAWAALAFPVGAAVFQRQIGKLTGAVLPAAAVSAALFAVGFIEALEADAHSGVVPYPELLLVLYAVALYSVYALFRRRPESFLSAPLPLYAGHAALLISSVRILDGALAVSIVWAVAAIVALLYAVKRGDRIVGQSSLVIFCASGLKVLLHDLSGSAPIVRVGVLVVLAASLYTGGWLYQQLGRGQERLHPDDEINAQLTAVRALQADGLDDAAIARELERRGVERRGSDAPWDAELIAQIRSDYGFG